MCLCFIVCDLRVFEGGVWKKTCVVVGVFRGDSSSIQLNLTLEQSSLIIYDPCTVNTFSLNAVKLARLCAPRGAFVQFFV